MEENTNKTYITYSDKMVSKPFKHPKGVIDEKTGDVASLVSITLPSADYRNLKFGKDENGIDRDDRQATIVFRERFVYDNKSQDGKLLNHYSYVDAQREYKINFKGMEIGQENGVPIYDKPEPAFIKGTDLAGIFKDAQQISHQKKKEKAEKEANKEVKPKEATKKTASKTKKPTKSKNKAEPSR